MKKLFAALALLGSVGIVWAAVQSLTVSSQLGVFMNPTNAALPGYLWVTGGVSFFNITPGRPLYINAQGNITNASGTPDGTKFMRDDGVLVAGSSQTFNAQQFTVSGGNVSALSLIKLTNADNYGAATFRGQAVRTTYNPALADLDWTKSFYKLRLTVNTNITFSNVAQDYTLTAQFTNSGSFTITWPVAVKWPNTWDNNAPVVAANRITTFYFDLIDGETNGYIASAPDTQPSATLASVVVNRTGQLVITNGVVDVGPFDAGGGLNNYITNINGLGTNTTFWSWVVNNASTTNKGFQNFIGPTAFAWVIVNNTIDWNSTNSQAITLTGNTTFTFANTNDDKFLTLSIRQDATGGRTATWPAGIVWLNSTNQSTAPQINTNANQYSVIQFYEAAGVMFAEGPSWGPSTYIANLEAGIATADSTGLVPFKFSVPSAHLTNISEWASGGFTLGGIRSNGPVFMRYSGTNIEHLANYTAFVCDQGGATNITATTNTILGTVRRGSLTLPGSMWKENRVLNFSFHGKYWSAAAPGNSKLMLNLNSATATNTLWQKVFPVTGSGVAEYWSGDFKLHCITNTPTGAFQLSGRVYMQAGVLSTNYGITNIITVIDTTVDYRFDAAVTNQVTTTGLMLDNAIGEVK